MKALLSVGFVFFIVSACTSDRGILQPPFRNTGGVEMLDIRGLPLDENLQFQHIGVSDGLSQSTVFTIIQDSRGFLWFGTEDGLNRFDGKDFKVYRRDHDDPASIGDNWVLSIAEDQHGDLWIATLGGGLNRYDAETDRFERFTSFTAFGGSAGREIETYCVIVDRTGDVWIGSSNGLIRYDTHL